MIKILFLAHSFSIGGVQKVNTQLINGIDKTQFDVHVLYLKKGEFFKDIDLNEVKANKYGDVINLKSFKNILYIFRIIKYIKKNKVQLIHTIDPLSYFFAAIAAKITNIRHIRIQPNLISQREVMNFKTIKLLPLERWTDRYITLNYEAFNDLYRAGVAKKKIEVLQGFTQLNKKSVDITFDLKEELKIPQDYKIIITVHRLVRGKGLETFIEMIPLILSKYKKVIFLVVGDGPLMKELKSKSAELGISKSIIFFGFRKDIDEIISQSTFGVYPLGESAGMIDVLRLGKVLISKKNSSMDEYIIHTETGFLVDDNNPTSYANYSLKLLENTNRLKKLEEKQVEFVKNNLDGSKNLKRFENIIKNVLKGF